MATGKQASRVFGISAGVALAAAAALGGCAKDKEPVASQPAATASAAATSAGATGPATPASGAPGSASAEPSVDASFLSAIGLDAGLTPREGEELAVLLSRLYAPCASEALSVAECVAQHRPCADCGRAARYLATGVHAGWSPVAAQRAFRARFDRSEVVDLTPEGSPARGPSSAPVTLVEFGSYMCPHCAAEAPKLDAVQKAHPKDVRLVFKPMWSPRDELQVRATRAALAAAAQGKFWEMHFLLFANQPKFDQESIDGYAKSLGLDTNKLHTDMASPAVTDRMNKDIDAAKAAHIDSLPAIWINGRPELSFEDLDSRVAFEVAEKGR